MKLLKVLTIGSLLSVSSAYAATSGTLLLKGTVAPILSIDVQANASATTLDLVNGEPDTVIANVAEQSNAANGYTVTLSSQNAGQLVNQTLNSQVVDYTLTYGGQLYDLSTGDGVFTDGNPGTGQVVNKDVSINIVGNNTLAAGDYTDTVTFTIAAN